MAVGEDQNHQHAFGREANEFDMANRGLDLGGQHHTGAACDTRERAADSIEQAGNVLVGARTGRVDQFAVFDTDVTYLE